MKKRIKEPRAGSEAQYGPRLVGEILHNYLENSNEPLAVAYRERLFKDLYPNTEPCTVLKLLTREPGRMPVGAYLNGTIVHDSEEHYTFTEGGIEEKKAVSILRSPHVYKGTCVNVVRRADGNLYPTFNRPKYSESFGFQDFCLEAAKELIEVSGLGEKETNSEL